MRKLSDGLGREVTFSCVCVCTVWLCMCFFCSQVQLGLFKADIDAAFRRVPVKPEHRRFAYIAFSHLKKLLIAGHLGMPFGSIGSVHNWDRVGARLSLAGRV